MSLSVAFTTARSSLANTTTQITVSGKNVAGANDPTYSRKILSTTTTSDGSARLTTIGRATDAAVYSRMLAATTTLAGQEALLSGIERLQQTVGDTEDGWSPAALIGKLDSALSQYANAPEDGALAQQVLTSADNLAKTLNTATSSVQAVRAQADADMAASVRTINDLLSRFQVLNDAVIRGTSAGTDVTDEMDARDAIVAKLSEELGVEVQLRENNDMALYTDGGVTLFDKTARSVTFTATLSYGADTVGGAVFIDGIPVTSPSATTMPLQGGRLVGLATLRDEVAVTYQAQLDEIARGLLVAFAEADQVGADVNRLGLFNYENTLTPPADTEVPGYTAGLAGLIRVNAAVDPAQGGDLKLIRDGGINGADYVYNGAAADSFSGRVLEQLGALNGTQPFDAAAGLPTSQTLKDFAASSIGWLEGKRANVSTDVGYQSTLLATASTALSNATGVNIDDEYARQLQLEQSYQASAKLLSIIQNLYDTLFAAVG